jgi:hypothetical protein
MKRYFSGLNQANATGTEGVPDGLFLVQVERAQFRWHAHNPYYLVRFPVLEPKPLAGKPITGRLYCTPKTLWEVELVPARFRLRHRIDRQRRDRRSKDERHQHPPREPERHGG